MILLNLQVRFKVKSVAEPLFAKYEKELDVMQRELQTFLISAQTSIEEADALTEDDGDGAKLADLATKLQAATTVAEHHISGAKASAVIFWAI